MKILLEILSQSHSRKFFNGCLSLGTHLLPSPPILLLLDEGQ